MGKGAGAAGVDEPLLLPEFSGGHGGGASVSGAVFNLSTSIIGAGIMSIPAAMRVLGVVPALALIAAVALLSDVSVEFMLRYTGWASGPPSYAGIMGDAFGRRAGAAALNVFIAFTTAGTLVVYLIIIGDVLSGSAGAGDEHAGVLQELFGPQWWTGREFVILATAVVVLLPLVLLRRVGHLHHRRKYAHAKHIIRKAGHGLVVRSATPLELVESTYVRSPSGFYARQVHHHRSSSSSNQDVELHSIAHVRVTQLLSLGTVIPSLSHHSLPSFTLSSRRLQVCTHLHDAALSLSLSSYHGVQELARPRHGRWRQRSGGGAPAAGARGRGRGCASRQRVRPRRGVQRVDERGGRRDHVDPGGHAGARRRPGRGAHRRRRAPRQRRRGLHAPVHPGHAVVRGADGRLVRPRRHRAAQRLHRLQLRRDPHRLPHNHRGRDVRPRGQRGGARRGAAGVARAALVDRPGCGAGGGRGDSPASCAPEACRFAEVHVGRVHPLGGGLHAHHDGDRGVHCLQRHRQDAADAPGLLQPRIPVRALHRRPGHRRRLHLPLQRAPHPRGAEQDIGHEVGGAHLAGALLRHLRGRGLLRLPPLRRRHHARRARQLRPQLRLRRPAGAERRRAPQLRAAPRARLPAPPLLAPRQRRRAPLPGPPPAGHRHAPVRGAHRRAHGGALRARHSHPQHLEALPVHGLHVRRLHIAHLPWRNRSQGCSWDSEAEGQGNGGDDDHSGSDHEQHRHCFQRHELHQGRSERC